MDSDQGIAPELAVTQDEVMEYVELGMEDLDSEDLYALVEYSGSLGTQTEAEVTQEDIEQYLDDHIDDLDLDEFIITSEI